MFELRVGQVASKGSMTVSFLSLCLLMLASAVSTALAKRFSMERCRCACATQVFPSWCLLASQCLVCVLGGQV